MKLFMKNGLNTVLQKIFGKRDTLRWKTLNGATWSFLGSGSKGILRFTSNLILTRLLLPESFGLMATAMVILMLVQLFSDTGIKTALIQNQNGASSKYINTSFIIALLRSIILFFLVTLAINPLVSFYDQPQLGILLRIMSAALLVEGLINPALPLLIKKFQIKTQVKYEFASQISGFIATMILIYFFRSVSALALGYLLTSVFRVIWSYVVLPYMPRLKWDTQAGKELIHFGKFIIVNTMVGWAVINIDRMLLGKILDMEQLGFYNLAVYMGVFASDVMIQIFAQTYFPAVSSIAGDHKKVEEIYGKTMFTIISLAIPFLMLMVIFSNEIVSIIYDPRYQVVSLVLFWIGLKSIISTISNIQSSTMIALGRPALVTFSNAVGVLFLFITIPILSRHYGLTGSGIAVLSGTVIISIIQSALLIKRLGFNSRLVLSPWIHMLSISLSMTAIYNLGRFILSSQNMNDIIFIIFMAIMAGGVAAFSLLKLDLWKTKYLIKGIR